MTDQINDDREKFINFIKTNSNDIYEVIFGSNRLRKSMKKVPDYESLDYIIEKIIFYYPYIIQSQKQIDVFIDDKKKIVHIKNKKTIE